MPWGALGCPEVIGTRLEAQGIQSATGHVPRASIVGWLAVSFESLALPETPALETWARRAALSFRPRHALCALLVLLAAAAAALVWCQALDVPYWDEWENVPCLTGERTIDAQWLWSLHAQHRFVIPRLVYLGVMRVARNDFRVLPYVNVALLVTSAGILLAAARRARGSWRWSDALFPLALLSWGHAENMIWGFQIGFVLGVLSFCLLTAAVLRCARPLTSTRVLAAVVPLLCLPLVGGTGFTLALGFAPWLVGIAILGLGSRQERGAGAVALAGVLALGALLAAYAHGSRSELPSAIAPARIGGVAWDALEFLAGGIGPAAQAWHPLATVATGILLLATLALVARRALADRARGPIESGLFCLILAVSLLAAVVAWGRAPGARGESFVPRYVTLAAPLWCIFHLAWSAGVSSRAARAVSPALALLFVLALPQNCTRGLAICEDKSQRLRAFEMDAWCGLSVSELTRRHAGHVFPSDRDVEGSVARLSEFIHMLENAHIGPFALSPKQRWEAEHAEYLRSFAAHVRRPWIPILLEEDENRAHLALLSPAPGRIVWRVPSGRWIVRGSHGLRRDAWEVGRSDGVVFSILVRVPARQGPDQTIFRRWLRPVEIPGDRGPQPFEARFEVKVPAEVLLRADPGPAQNAD
jgi:hypothetical protein